jgi:zinc-ribbon domain
MDVFMAGKISVECPSCLAKLNLADSSKLGKKIRCPKCTEVFTPEAPDDDDFEDELEDEPKRGGSKKSSSSGAASAKGAKKGAKKGGASGGGSNLPVIIGGVLGLLALIGAGAFFSGIFNSKPLPAPPAIQPMPVAQPVQAPPAPPQISPAEKVLGLRWMPTETDVIIHAKISDIWKAPLLKEPLSSPSVTTGLKEFEKQFGMPLSEIESVSIGFVDLTGGVIKLMTAGAPAGAPGFPVGPAFPTMSPHDFHYVTVVRTKKPIDWKLISQSVPNTSMREKNGKSYFEATENPMQPANGGWSPEPNTLILATSKELMGTIERGETNVPRKELAGINHVPHLVVAGVVRGLRSEEIQQAEAKNITLPPFIAELSKPSDKYSPRMGNLGLTVKGGFDLQISAFSNSAEGTQNMKLAFESFSKELRSMFDGYKTTAPPLIGELGELLLANLKIEDQNQKVTLSTGVPDSAQEKLEQLPAVVMMMAMMGGFSGAPPMGAASNLGASPGSILLNQPLKTAPTISLPGETESVEASMVEGLAEELTLTAKTAWSTLPALPTTDGKVTETIEILLDLKGDGLDSICAATGVTSKTLTIGSGSLKKSKRTPPGGIDAQKTFLAFDEDTSLPGEHPPETLRVRLAVDVPQNLPTKIDVLEGSFKIMTAGNSQELSVENVPQRAKTPLNDPEFKAGGVKLIRGPKDVFPQTLKLQCGEDFYVGRVRGTPGDVVSFTEVEKGVTIQRIYANQPDGKFPDEFEIAFKLHTDLKEQKVTFRFENVPLPAAETKPGFQQQQVPLQQQ